MAFVKCRKGKPFVEDLSDFEREFWERVRALGRAVFTEELSKADVDAEAIVVEGVVHRRVLRGTETYMTTAGPVVVERTLYKDRTDPGARAISGFESRACCAASAIQNPAMTPADAQGQQSSAIRMARMPEHKKATLKRSLPRRGAPRADARAQPEGRKDRRRAGDNWDFLGGPDLPGGTELVDFFHAAEHLHGALAAAYGDGTPKTREGFATLRHLLLDEVGGVEKVIRALHYLRDENPRTQRIAEELAYFRRHRKRMNYAEVKAQGLPIGSASSRPPARRSWRSG